MAKYPAQLQSANLNEFGIVYAEEIQGHKTVATLNALYAITDPILSKSVVNTNNDAIGQEWFVTSEGCYYRLDNWANRHTASGWTKLQVIDTEFNSLSAHGADKIKNFTTSPSTVTLNYNTWRSSTVNEDGTAVINAATQSAAGVLSAADKTKVDRITTANFALGAVTPAASSVAIAATKTTISTGVSAANNITLPAATASVAGVMTAADKVKLDTTLPNLINSNKTTIDNYTVNGIKISTNPVVTGANTKVTGYSKPTTTGAIAATDSINGALGKLEKKLDDEVTNRTNAVSNLTNTVNNNKTTIDNYTVGGIKISANPKVANGTNTTVSTANSTITWSLNSTISLTRVNASSGFYQTSDKRLKSDIKPLEHTLEEICSIPTDSFILGGKKDLGTIAQELEPTFPELVTDAELKQSDVPNPENFETIEKDGETYVLVKEVDYAKMSVLAIEGIKLLKAEIDELKKQLLDK